MKNLNKTEMKSVNGGVGAAIPLVLGVVAVWSRVFVTILGLS